MIETKLEKMYKNLFTMLKVDKGPLLKTIHKYTVNDKDIIEIEDTVKGKLMIKELLHLRKNYSRTFI